MSLNGLDEAKVAEAYHAALSEAGGWFLLKYATRDTVELLARGVGGVAEVKSTISKYEEKSPLYGLVQFRRKRIILKYVPDGTSRLLQVRLTVQFQSVLETFSPHDTVLSFATAAELTESALTAACMLHPSAMSMTSSASSVRKQKLGEIMEDTEERPHVRGESKTKVMAMLPTPAPVAQAETALQVPEFSSISAVVANPPPFLTKEQLPPAPSPLGAHPLKEQLPPALSPLRAYPPIEKAQSKESVSNSTPTQFFSTPAPTHEVPSSEKSLPATPDQTPPNTSDGRTTTNSIPDDVPDLPPIQHLSNSFQVEEFNPRPSVQSSRPSLHRLDRPNPYNLDTYDPYKPKVKRGPRPHVEPETRPKTAGEAKKPKLVAGLPPSLVRTASRAVQPSGRPGSRQSMRPESRQSTRSVPSKFVHPVEPANLPPIPLSNHISSLFLPKEEHQYSSAESITSTATARATPEKLRLMKALQMRKKAVQPGPRTAGMSKAANLTPTSIPQQESPNLNESQRPESGTESIPAEVASVRSSGEADKVIEVTRMTSPTSMTQVSEVPSTQTSSEFVDDKDETISRGSISSDTSSSVTPRADLKDMRKETPPDMPPMSSEPGIKPALIEKVVNTLEEKPLPVIPEKLISEEMASTEEIDDDLAAGEVTAQAEVPEEEVVDELATGEVATEEKVVEMGVDKDSIAQDVATADVKEKEMIPETKSMTKEPVSKLLPAFGVIETDLSQAHTPFLQLSESATPGGVQTIEHARPSTSTSTTERGARKKFLEPIKLLASPDLSDVSDDESFMEELQNATVEEAKPMAVGRSPVTPIYRNLSVDRLKDFDQSASPVNTTRTPSSPEELRARSLRSTSTALPSWLPNDTAPVPLAKKGPLSHGISKRIKALEVFTSRDRGDRDREPSPSTTSPPQQQPPSTRLASKSKAALASSRKRLSFVKNPPASNISTSTPAPTQLPTSTAPAHLETSDFQGSNAQIQRKMSSTGMNSPHPKGETISVTARIVRNPNAANGNQAHDSTENTPIQLQRSALIIEHNQAQKGHRSTMSREASGLTADDTPKSPQSERGRPSFSSYRSDSHGHFPQSESMASRLSVASSGRKKGGRLFARSISDKSSIAEEKPKSSRAARLLKRVSNLSRRNQSSSMPVTSKEDLTTDTIAERDESDAASVLESISHVVDIGDVNVQFPDTLLWKRRFLRIDDQGYLIFTPPAMERNTRNISRRFHLSEFKKPTLPDVEREEMAWSILLDLEDGSTIQCACESKYAQGQVLRMIGDAHSAYHQLYSS